MVQRIHNSGANPSRRAAAELVPARELLSAAVRGVASIIVSILLVLTLVATAMLMAFGPAARLVRVPQVVALPVEAAKERLEADHLILKVVNYEYNPEVREGDIVATSPYEGKQVRAGREVRATVSRGSRMVKVPDLKGLELQTATTKLTALDLQVGSCAKQANDKPADSVLNQKPAPGTTVARKTKVDVALSGGPDFGEYEGADGKSYLFRTLKITVPEGKALQSVSVDVAGAGMERSFLERLGKPGEVIEVELYGPQGARVRVKIEDERVYSERL
jgi:hypothetical protein